MSSLILLVDDFADARDIYGTYLTYQGHRVLCAQHGTEAISLARDHRPDLILMDLRMPGLTGEETLRVLRSDPCCAAIPIIAFTAHALEDERNAALSAGFDGVIAKPCLPDELLKKILNILSEWHASDRPS